MISGGQIDEKIKECTKADAYGIDVMVAMARPKMGRSQVNVIIDT